jgi:malonyl-CoA decarboxylase
MSNLPPCDCLNLSANMAMFVKVEGAADGARALMNTSFFGELLQSIVDRGRALIARERRDAPRARSETLADRCETLLSGRGEASGAALASEILDQYAELTIGPRIAFFETLAERFGVNRAGLDASIAAWRAKPTDAAAAEIHHAAEPRRQELFRRLNLAPGGTAALVHMREQLLDALDRRADLAAVNADFVHLFSSWFNRGFLVLRRIDWSTPAVVLEKIIRYEAVHKIGSWDDLRRRIDPPDRVCYAFFHPALVDEPLIFVEVALTREIPGAIAPILAVERAAHEPDKATTAVFYSISNCQRGLTGVSFGHFLIKQVVEEISREHNRLSTYVTLSPVPDFAAWLSRERKTESSRALAEADRVALANVDRANWWQSPVTREEVEEPLLRAAAWYFLQARNKRGSPVDSVARFHLGNGARLERLNYLADTSDKAIAQSCGLMVNYRYDIDDIEKNHEAYAESRAVVASNAVKRLVPKTGTELVKAG